MALDPRPAAAGTENLDRPWHIWSSVAIAAFVVFSVVLGFIVLPSAGQPGFDPFSALCRAIGIPGFDKPAPGPDVTASAPSSAVTWSTATLHALAGGNAARGLSVVQDTCAACHGENGISTDPQQFPDLAGQSEASVFKELHDFQSGARKSDIMEPVAQGLTAEQIADVAAYYSTQPPVARPAPGSGVTPAIEHLVLQGDPARGIAACVSCHGASHSGPQETPSLVGEPAPYLEEQLQNFASAARSNDEFERMRVIAGALTPAEMHGLALYYGGNPPPAP